jgi:sporulation protein YlmC with PRC-barrel domain
MNDLEFTITKNKLEILLLKAQEGLKVGRVTQSKLDAVETLQSSLKLIIQLRSIIDELNKKNTLVALQNVKAYKETAELKNKLTNFKK